MLAVGSARRSKSCWVTFFRGAAEERRKCLSHQTMLHEKRKDSVIKYYVVVFNRHTALCVVCNQQASFSGLRYLGIDVLMHLTSMGMTKTQVFWIAIFTMSFFFPTLLVWPESPWSSTEFWRMGCSSGSLPVLQRVLGSLWTAAWSCWMPQAKEALETAKAKGVRNILANRGDGKLDLFPASLGGRNAMFSQ